MSNHRPAITRASRIAAGLLTIATLAGPSPAVAQNPAGTAMERAVAFVTPPATPIGNLAWLTGCWERRSGNRLVEEQWMAPRGAMMLGQSRTVRGDTLVEYEQLRIYERDGKLVFAANPSGQAPSEFVSTTLSDSIVIFENPQHDFPQRIVYRRAGADSLTASVDGISRGKERRVSFPYARAICPTGSTPAR